MRRISYYLLATAAFIPAAAHAESAVGDARAAEAAEAAEAPGDGTEADTADIVVFGQGQSRQVQRIKAEDIQILTPGTSAIRAIEKLPSVNIQSADPFGNYE